LRRSGVLKAIPNAESINLLPLSNQLKQLSVSSKTL